MDKLSVNFVLEFAKDLYKLLDKLDKEFGSQIDNGNKYYKKKILVKASDLTGKLYAKYKQSLDLKMEFIGDIGNIVLENSNYERIYLPRDYLESKKFFYLTRFL